MLSDAFLLQVKDTSDSIDNFSRGNNGGDGPVNFLHTKAGLTIPLPEDKNYYFTDTCTLIVNKGFFTRKPVSADIIEGVYHHHYVTSILDRTVGSDIVTMLTLLLFAFVTWQWIVRKTINEKLLLVILFFLVFFIMEIWY